MQSQEQKRVLCALISTSTRGVPVPRSQPVGKQVGVGELDVFS